MPDEKITQPLCQRCQHARTFHGSGGRCKALGCSSCESYVSPAAKRGPVGYPYGEKDESVVVRAGQVWRDNDPRSPGRTLRVDEVVLDDGEPYARATVMSVAPAVSASGVGKVTHVKIRRFRPTQTGYVLDKDA